jgi:hypothetical protein
MSIEAMKQAHQVPLVEQLESVPADARLVIDDADGMGTRYIPVGRMCHDAAKTIRAAIEQAEKMEPVAWQWLNTAHYRKKLPKDAERGAWNPLYTTPQPQREWVGLTGEERLQISDDSVSKMIAVLETEPSCARRTGETHDPRNHHADTAVPGRALGSGAGPVPGGVDCGLAMNRDDIIRMAREAGMAEPQEVMYNNFWTADQKELERFAALVAAAERNRTWTQDHWTEYERSIAAAERDRLQPAAECFRMCEHKGVCHEKAKSNETN